MPGIKGGRRKGIPAKRKKEADQRDKRAGKGWGEKEQRRGKGSGGS